MADTPLPLFPLAHVVLFPCVQTALHLFEPRYRQLARDVMAGERRIGMVAVPPEHAPAIPGDPPLYSVGCEGHITQCRKRSDGRYDLVLNGERRFQIDDEVPYGGTRLYRSARVTLLEDPYPESARPRVASCRANILESLGQILERQQPNQAQGFPNEQLKRVDDERFVNTLANVFRFPVEEKQLLLETNNILDRFEVLAGLLDTWLQNGSGARVPGNRTLH